MIDRPGNHGTPHQDPPEYWPGKSSSILGCSASPLSSVPFGNPVFASQAGPQQTGASAAQSGTAAGGAARARSSGPKLIYVGTYVLLLLSTVFVSPYLVQQYHYAARRGRGLAEADVARSLLTELPQAEHRFRLAAQAVSPSVVNIETRLQSPLTPAELAGRPTPEAKGRLDGQVGRGEGSGIILDAGGRVLTNNHVIVRAIEITVQLHDGRRFPAELLAEDDLTDLAVLQLKPDGLGAPSALRPVVWGDSDQLQVGDSVLAVGSPFGLDQSVTAGIISAKGRHNVGNGTYQDYLQTDAAVNPGNSGGPLVNMLGEVVGINTAIVGQNFQGISFAIPSSIAQSIAQQLSTQRSVKRGFLGVHMETLDPNIAAARGVLPGLGVLVRRVRPGTPADQAGIRPEDIITRWQGIEVNHPADLRVRVGCAEVGSAAELEILRQGNRQVLQVQVGQWDEPR